MSTPTADLPVAAEPSTLTLVREGGVATLTLTRPDLLNRFDDALHVDFIAALGELAEDTTIRAVVLASTGKVFSAGGDFELMTAAQADAGVRGQIVKDAQRLLTRLLTLPQPIVAAVQGAAIGLGATVALSCDAVVAARSAQLADSHVNIGLVAGDGGAVVWPASVGFARARRHLLTGDPLLAETAHTLGLVSDLVDTPEEVGGAAHAIAARIAALPPLAVQLTKRTLIQSLLNQAGSTLELGLAHEERSLASDDLLEGIRSIRERTPGNYTGR
jgi:enoyl-CoA hydratase